MKIICNSCGYSFDYEVWCQENNRQCTPIQVGQPFTCGGCLYNTSVESINQERQEAFLIPATTEIIQPTSAVVGGINASVELHDDVNSNANISNFNNCNVICHFPLNVASVVNSTIINSTVSGSQGIIEDPIAIIPDNNFPIFQIKNKELEMSVGDIAKDSAFRLGLKKYKYIWDVLRIDMNGNFFVNGHVVANDIEVYNAFVSFLSGAGILKRPLTPDQNVILHNDPLIGGLSRYDIAKNENK